MTRRHALGVVLLGLGALLPIGRASLIAPAPPLERDQAIFEAEGAWKMADSRADWIS